MSWLSSIFSSGAATLVDSVSKGLDNLFTSDEERLKANNILQQAMNDYNIKVQEAVNAHEKEITARWKSDNEHFLTRLVRPLVLIYLLIVLTIMAFMDGNIGNFHIATAYIPLFQALAVTAVGGYFVVRTFDKHSTNKYKDK